MNPSVRSKEEMADNIQNGSPWKHCLEVRDLGPGKLDAAISLGGANWIWPTAGISLAIALLLGFASFSAFGAGKTGGGIAAGCQATTINYLDDN